MINNNNISSYNFTHISNYVNGTMSREDMYAFEKAMLTDPFLEDAVEGFREANIKKAETDLAAIKTALLPEKESTKIVPFYNAYKTWFSAAAVIIVIATIGAVTFSIFKPNNNNQQVAIVTPQIEKPKTFTDTTPSINNSPTITTNKPTITASKKQPVIVADKEVVAENSMTTNNRSTAIVNIDSNKNAYYGDAVAQVKAEELKDVKISNIDQALQGRLAGVNVDNKLSKKMGPMNTINSNNGFTTTTNNTQNFFATPAKDSTQTARNTLDEVIVIGYGSVKKRDVAASVAKVAIDPLESLMPVGGWQYYSKYMNQKIGFIGDTTSNNHLVITDRSGQKLDDIDIEFSVDKEGSAYNVKVITDVDSTQAKTIANAVIEGPKWISRKKKNKVKIPLKTP